jgi:hypothetical protein
MRTRTTHDIPVRLAAIRRGFDRWRRTRQGRPRIPEELWALAVEAAGQYGLYSTAQALRLDYYSLKKHVEAARRGPPRRTRRRGCPRTPGKPSPRSPRPPPPPAPPAPPADRLNPPPESNAGRRYASLPEGHEQRGVVGACRAAGSHRDRAKRLPNVLRRDQAPQRLSQQGTGQDHPGRGPVVPAHRRYRLADSRRRASGEGA